MRGFSALAVPLLNGLTFAISWDEPLPTPQGLLDAAGVSPRPTAAPGANNTPVELRRRQQDVLYPPPDNWCGFIEGDYGNLPAALFSTIETSTSSTASSTSLPAPPITPSPTIISSSDDGVLSANAIRGIAIGVSIGVCAILILVAIFIVRRQRANRMKRASQPNLPPAYAPAAPMQLQQQNNVAYQPVPQQDQPYSPDQAGYFAPSVAGKEGATVTSQPSLSPGQDLNQQQRYSNAQTSLLAPNNTGPGASPVSGRDSIYRSNGSASPTITEIDGSERPLPEADSIQRPQSTHQGMVSPMQMGSSAGSPPPSSGHFMQQYGNPSQGQQPGQGQVNDGYMVPRAGTHEMPPTQPYLGPHEMPNERH
ncbi:MAG: hypothetical protein LQ343_007222 [Gyalolechia ehrenbergii]|nr:MAG: hypothetical protein LQ343_007222 [Gyalolechia ehrenbergii]